MSSDRDQHMAEVLAFKCAHAVPEAKPCAEVTAQMWLKEIRWYRNQEAKHGRI